MEFFRDFLSNKKTKKIAFIIFLVVVFISIAFLTINLFLFYNRTIKPNNSIPLYYEFKPNTVHNDLEYSSANDISEQFLSYAISYGVDVSEWQGSIDWQKVKATGISFAIIRCGFRQTHGSDIIEDAKFRENIEGAIAAGLKVGVYFFGTAKNESEAIEEAEFTLNLIKDYNISYPVVYDAESFNTGRLEGVSYSTITDNVLAFTETVASYGYETMVYSYHNALSNILDMGKLEGKLIWLAHFVEQTNYKGNYDMWQYSEQGRVDGIKTNVDLNVSYFTYVDSEDKIIANPNYVESPKVAMTLTEDRVITTSNATMRTSPTIEIPNSLGSIPKNTILIRKEQGEEFSLISYNGKTVYISNKDIETFKS